MKIVDRKTFLAMPEGTVYCKIQFRDPLPTERAVAKHGWDSSFDIENPYIKGETWGDDFLCCGLGSEYPKEGDHFDVLHDICDHLGKEVPFEMAGGRDGFFDDTHVHFAIYSREEVQEMINELQESLRTAYPQRDDMKVEVRVRKADLEKCETQLDVIELVSGEWLKQHNPFKRK